MSSVQPASVSGAAGGDMKPDPGAPPPKSATAVQSQSTVLRLAGLSVHFPLQPFRQQVQVMTRMIDALTRHESAILESPTGTGKTLALLCGALAYQARCRAEAYEATLKVAVVSAGAAAGVEVEVQPPQPPSTATAKSSKAGAPVAVAMDVVAAEGASTAGGGEFVPVAVGAPATVGHAAGTVAVATAAVRRSARAVALPLVAPPPPVPRIYFTSRTHSQLAQVARELRKCGAYVDAGGAVNVALREGAVAGVLADIAAIAARTASTAAGADAGVVPVMGSAVGDAATSSAAAGAAAAAAATAAARGAGPAVATPPPPPPPPLRLRQPSPQQTAAFLAAAPPPLPLRAVLLAARSHMCVNEAVMATQPERTWAPAWARAGAGGRGRGFGGGRRGRPVVSYDDGFGGFGRDAEDDDDDDGSNGYVVRRGAGAAFGSAPAPPAGRFWDDDSAGGDGRNGFVPVRRRVRTGLGGGSVDEDCRIAMRAAAGCAHNNIAPRLADALPPVWDLEDIVALSRSGAAGGGVGGGSGASSGAGGAPAQQLQQGAGAGGCPYFAARALFSPPAGDEARRAQLVLCPYSYLLDPVLREAMGIDLTGAIVIFDEAHNIEDTARDAASLELNRGDLAEAAQSFGAVAEKAAAHGALAALFGRLLSWTDAAAARLQLAVPPTARDDAAAAAARGWVHPVVAHAAATAGGGGGAMPAAAASGGGGFAALRGTGGADGVWGGGEALAVLAGCGLTAGSLADYATAYTAAVAVRVAATAATASFRGAGAGIAPTSAATTGALRSAERLLLTAQFMLATMAPTFAAAAPRIYAEDYHLAVQPPAASGGGGGGGGGGASASGYRVCLWCLNPAAAFSAVARSAQSVVLTSGTLSPLDSFASELGVPFNHRLEAGHVIDVARQLWAGVVHAAPHPRGLQLVLDGRRVWSARDAPPGSAIPRPLRSPWAVRAAPAGSGSGGVQVGPLTGTFKAADDAYLDRVGAALLQLSVAVPGGLLVFFASYGAMGKAVARWSDATRVEVVEQDAAGAAAAAPSVRSVSLWAALRRVKRVFVEQGGSAGGGDDFTAMLTAFRDVVTATAGHAGHCLGATAAPPRAPLRPASASTATATAAGGSGPSAHRVASLVLSDGSGSGGRVSGTAEAAGIVASGRSATHTNIAPPPTFAPMAIAPPWPPPLTPAPPPFSTAVAAARRRALVAAGVGSPSDGSDSDGIEFVPPPPIELIEVRDTDSDDDGDGDGDGSAAATDAVSAAKRSAVAVPPGAAPLSSAGGPLRFKFEQPGAASPDGAEAAGIAGALPLLARGTPPHGGQHAGTAAAASTGVAALAGDSGDAVEVADIDVELMDIDADDDVGDAAPPVATRGAPAGDAGAAAASRSSDGRSGKRKALPAEGTADAAPSGSAVPPPPLPLPLPLPAASPPPRVPSVEAAHGAALSATASSAEAAAAVAVAAAQARAAGSTCLPVMSSVGASGGGKRIKTEATLFRLASAPTPPPQPTDGSTSAASAAAAAVVVASVPTAPPKPAPPAAPPKPAPPVVDSAADDAACTGAMLLAVCRGKASEGLDFADQFARAVVLVGIPYASVREPTVELKKQYQDKRLAEARTAAAAAARRSGGAGAGGAPLSPAQLPISGQAWYQQQAFRALNQSLGRVIRHRRDYGAVVLLDSRFGAPDAVASLSAWARGAVRRDVPLDAAARELSRFFEGLADTPPAGGPAGSGPPAGKH